MASKQLVNNLSKVGRCAEKWLTPLTAVRYSSSDARCDIEKVTHTGQVSGASAVHDRMRLRKHCFHSAKSFALKGVR